MDLMELRRGIMLAMVSGKEFVSGTFTTGQSSTYTLNFGKSFNRYMYLIEMTDSSKTNLENSGQTSAKMYACCGIYPSPAFNDDVPFGANVMISYRIIPSTSQQNTSASTASMDNSSITMTNNNFSNGANVFYKGESYKYIVISLD